jgi:phosphatidylglycerol lysyltransferase
MSLLALDHDVLSHGINQESLSARLEDFAFRYGRSAESYLVTEPGRESFWLPDYSGVIVYLRRGRYLHVGGGLLAADADKPLLLEAFTRWTTKSRLRPLFYNIAPDEVPLFRGFGFQVTKWGEEAMIDLPEATWKGKRYEWVRRQSNYATRHGLDFAECQPENMSAEAWDRLAQELTEVANGILSQRPQMEDIGFLNGHFDPVLLGRRRLFLARNTQLGRIEGFLLCNPCRGGNEWALELYRDRPDAVRGTIPFLMHQALQQFQHEQIERASLCLVPGVRCDRPLPGDSALIRHAMVLSHYFTFIFDVAGLYHFKSRFRPRFEDRFICARPAVTLGAARSFIGLSGALRINLLKLLSNLWKKVRYARSRSTLAAPPPEL